MRRIPLCVSLAACLLLNAASVFSQSASQSPIVHKQAGRTIAPLPVVFEANRGQTDPRVHFLVRGTGYTLFLTPTETMFVETKTAVGIRRSLRTSLEDSKTLMPAVVRMKLVGGNLSPELTGVAELPGKVSYILGNNPGTWHTGVPLYAQVRSKQGLPWRRSGFSW